jgi:septum formation topological specificity factor MinE
MTDLPIKSVLPTKADEALRDDIMALVQRHLTPDTPDRVLAIASQVVGQVLALQDQRTMTKERALQLIMANIETGNAGVIERLHNTKGRA